MGTTTGAANTEGKCLLIIYNYCLYPSPPSKIDVALDPTDTLSALRDQVAQKTGYPSEAFELYLGSQKNPFQDSDDDKTLTELKIPIGKCMLQLRRKPGSKDSDFGSESAKKALPQIKTTTPSMHIGAAASPSYSNALVPIGPVTEAGAAGNYRSSYSSMDWNKKSKTGFVGLSNQGATCYMNSLIQTLYMTPEFRSAIYKWSFEKTWKKRERERKEKLVAEGKMEVENDPTEEERKREYEKDSIPRQLQLLFARLQLRDIRAVKTKNLTNSFGWKESDAFTQHDVQELCRVLFDALEKVFKGTEQETLINDLYQGEMKDYVRCKVCDHESLRTDKYLDIPLVIRGFGSTTAIKSVEEALSKFVQPELLYGDNQYKCGKCNINVDATKGLKFTSFPYLLTLQLKRFDFDYNTFRRIKLNDLVTFPYTLDLNEFIEDVSDSKQQPTKRKLNEEEEQSEPMELDLNEKEEENNDINNNNTTTKSGPYIYELYSVLIHRGSALGGHYYAYIKSFEQNKWFEFNDSTVTEINEEDIKKSFGDEDRPKGYAQYYHSSANAYMLMYRRVDSSKNVVAVTNEDVPKELKDYIQLENDKKKRKQEEREKEREMVKLKVFYLGIEKEVKLHQSTTIADATAKCAQAFDIRNEPSCIRLRNYQTYNSLPQEPLDSEDIQSKTLDNLNFYSGKALMVETREASEKFPEYNPQDMMLRVIVYDQANEKFLEPKQVFVDKDARLGELKKILATKFRIPPEKQRILREAIGYGVASAKILQGDSELLRLEHRVFEASKIYLEHCDNPESESPAAAEIERTKNMIEVKFNMPGKDEATMSVTVSRKMTFGEFKKLVSPMINLPVDEFRVSRGTIHWKIELKSEKESLEEHKLSDGSKVIIEKGKPLKEGETVLKFHLFDPFNKRIKDTFEEVFESAVTEDLTIISLKEKLCLQLKQEKNIDILPTRLRLREMYSRNPSKVYKDKNTLKDSCNVLYSGKSLAMQELEHEEDVVNDSDIAIFVQRWYPSKYELGQKYEITVNEDKPVAMLKNLLCEKFGISNIGIAKVMGSWPGPDILDISDMYWNKEVPEWQGEGKSGSIGHTPYYLRDGDILFFKDNDEIEKELTKEEKAKLEKEANIKKRPTYYAKEEALHINAKV